MHLCGCLVCQRQVYWHKPETHRPVWHCRHCCQWGGTSQLPTPIPNPSSPEADEYTLCISWSFCFFHVLYRQDIPSAGKDYSHTSSLYCALQTLFFFLNKLKVCGNSALSKSTGAIFPTGFLTLCLCVTFWQFLKYFKPSANKKDCDSLIT